MTALPKSIASLVLESGSEPTRVSIIEAVLGAEAPDGYN